jgi:hypothetical protein
MKEKTFKKLQSLNEQLDDLHQFLTRYDEDTLNKRPKPGVWSALDVVQHLRISESLSHQYLQKKLSGDPGKMGKAGLRSSLRSMAITLFMRSPAKRQAPKIVNESNFPERSDVSELMQDWKQQRSELESFLRKQPDVVFEKEVYRHPFGGRLSLLGMLRFFETHIERHRKQIERTLQQVA